MKSERVVIGCFSIQGPSGLRGPLCRTWFCYHSCWLAGWNQSETIFFFFLKPLKKKTAENRKKPADAGLNDGRVVAMQKKKPNQTKTKKPPGSAQLGSAQLGSARLGGFGDSSHSEDLTERNVQCEAAGSGCLSTVFSIRLLLLLLLLLQCQPHFRMQTN